MKQIREERPLRRAIADAVYTSLSENIALKPQMRVMDYGCGTGLIAVPLSKHVQKVYGVESSERQLSILQEKIDELKISTLQTCFLDLSKKSWIEQPVDLILTSMTMHHIVDTKKIAEQFYLTLTDKGFLAIADLDREDGSFHKDNSDVAHYGFEREDLIALLHSTGFELMSCHTAHQIKKLDKNGKEISYPMFLLLMRKKGDSET